MYILHHLNPFIMNTSFVYTFRIKNSVLNHLRALAQLSSSMSHSNLPMSDFLIDYPYLFTALTILKTTTINTLYVGFRNHGFEFQYSLSSLMERLRFFSDIIAVYQITFVNGYYELRQYHIN